MKSQSNDNAFDLIRVLAALAVLYSHSFALYGLPEPSHAGQTLGSLAVAIFFAVSGFLVCQSWQRDPDVYRFTLRRGLRILPGLIVAVAFTAFVAGALDTRLPLYEFLTARGTWAYFVTNVSLIGGDRKLPGAFLDLPFSSAPNGSLWTLTYEVLMYGMLVLLGLSRHFKTLCLLAFVGFTAAWAFMGSKGYTIPIPFIWKFGLAVQGDRLAYLGAYFFGACVVYLYRLPLSLLFASVMVVAVLLGVPILAVALPYATIVLAYKLPLRSIGGWDVSYGIYVYAFPVQQLATRYCLAHGLGWIGALAISLVVTVMFAALSWRLIEKPALGLKNYLSGSRRTATGAA